MTILSIPNFLALSIFLYFIFSGEKSCMTLVIMQRLKELFLEDSDDDNDDADETEEEKNDKPIIKFEGKYLERFKATE